MCIFLFCLPLTVTVDAQGNPGTIHQTLIDKIGRLIDRPDLSPLESNQCKIEIEFVVTRKHEILVLGVYTDQEFLDNYVKRRLNYKRVNVKGVRYMAPYLLDVTFRKQPIR